MNARILVVDDDTALAEMIGIVLRTEGFEPHFCEDGGTAVDAFRSAKPDLVLLDLMLPGLSGIDVCARIREESGVPIIMLTAKSDTADVVKGLESGADDYVVKPFSPSELVARVRAVLRRSRPALSEEKLVCGDITMDLATHRVSRGGNRIHLGPTEYRLLRLFLERPYRVFTREQLLDQVWGRDIHVELRTVDVHIRRLRKALGSHGDDDVIRTVRGTGYALDVDEAAA